MNDAYKNALQAALDFLVQRQAELEDLIELYHRENGLEIFDDLCAALLRMLGDERGTKKERKALCDVIDILDAHWYAFQETCASPEKAEATFNDLKLLYRDLAHV